MAAQDKPSLREAIRRLEILSRRLVTSRLTGGYKSAFKGRGMEFEGFREYNPGDDASLIDWKASSRSDKVLVREFLEERNLVSFLLVDKSATMDFGTQDKLKFEFATEVASSLAYLMLEAGDSVGAGVYSEHLNERSLPSDGVTQYYRILRILSGSPVQAKSSLKRALEYTLSFLDKDSLLIIISDFLSVSPETNGVISLASRKYETIALCIRDPRDLRLPSGVGEIVLSDPYSEKQYVVDSDSVREEYERGAAAQLASVRRLFEQNGADFLLLETDHDYIDPLSQLFNRRNARRK